MYILVCAIFFEKYLHVWICNFEGTDTASRPISKFRSYLCANDNYFVIKINLYEHN